MLDISCNILLQFQGEKAFVAGVEISSPRYATHKAYACILGLHLIYVHIHTRVRTPTANTKYFSNVKVRFWGQMFHEKCVLEAANCN